MKLQKNALEWSVFGVSLLLVLGVLAFLVREATTLRGMPALLDARAGKVQRRVAFKSVQYVVPVTVHNQGETTASSVLVEVSAKRADGKTPDLSAEVTLEWAPRGSQREAFVVFESDPQGEIAARIVSFEEQ